MTCTKCGKRAVRTSPCSACRKREKNLWTYIEKNIWTILKRRKA